MTVISLKPKLTSARLLSTGYVIALDQWGRQMPQFSGKASDVLTALEREGVTIERSQSR